MKKITGCLMSIAMVLSLCGCTMTASVKEDAQDAAKQTEETQETIQPAQESPAITVETEPEEKEEAPAEAEESAQVTEKTLPPYEYPGPELFYSVLYQYLADQFDAQYPDAQVGIPCPIIIAEDESNNEDIRVWGDFWYFKYDLNGDILECTSGGSYPGLIHVKSTDEGYEVTGMDLVEDGSDFDPSAKKIFGSYYDAFIKSEADTEGRDATRAQIIANYAFANDLSITAFKDYGWDPVPLPEENIDSFYSILD